MVRFGARGPQHKTHAHRWDLQLLLPIIVIYVTAAIRAHPRHRARVPAAGCAIVTLHLITVPIDHGLTRRSCWLLGQSDPVATYTHLALTVVILDAVGAILGDARNLTRVPATRTLIVALDIHSDCQRTGIHQFHRCGLLNNSRRGSRRHQLYLRSRNSFLLLPIVVIDVVGAIAVHSSNNSGICPLEALVIRFHLVANSKLNNFASAPQQSDPVPTHRTLAVAVIVVDIKRVLATDVRDLAGIPIARILVVALNPGPSLKHNIVANDTGGSL